MTVSRSSIHGRGALHIGQASRNGGTVTYRSIPPLRTSHPRATTTTDPNDFIEQVEFSTTGLPIKETGPADQIGYLPITTRIWDSNGSLLCERGPEAHAIDEEAPSGGVSGPS
ncbi:MAG: hypothetical protein WD276_07370 [Actinomycetota bacterium]